MAEGLSRKQIEMLLGGYAAGTLTPAEQQALFAAALEDQTLFDALADEEALRELLADPVTRAELRAVVEPRRASWWAWLRNPALGGLAIGAAVATLLLVFVLRPRHTATPPPKPVEMAQNREAPAAQPPAAEAAPAPKPRAAKPRQFQPPTVTARPAEPEAPAPMPPPPAIAAESAAPPLAKKEMAMLPAPPSPVTSYRDMNQSVRVEAAAPARAKSRRMAAAPPPAPGFQDKAGYLDRPNFTITLQRNDAAADNSTPFALEDRIRLSVAIHAAGYLYAFERRGAADWQRIFPTDAVAARMEPGATFRIPIAATEPGRITVRVVFTPRPLDLATTPDFRRLLYRDMILEFR